MQGRRSYAYGTVVPGGKTSPYYYAKNYHGPVSALQLIANMTLTIALSFFLSFFLLFLLLFQRIHDRCIPAFIFFFSNQKKVCLIVVFFNFLPDSECCPS